METNQFKLTLEDNMDLMARYPDNYFDLSIVDPPYGIGMHKQRVFDDGKEWDEEIPSDEYFIELKRVSKNQIIWGGNYFKQLWPCKGFLIWDKHQPEGLTFAMVELATCTIDRPAKMYFTKPAGERGFYTVDCKRLHPTQKPVKLYEWLLKNYAETNQKILDTHLGSMSIAIALDKVNKFDGMNLHLTGCELDKDYYEAGIKRIKDQTRQTTIFE